MCIYSEHEHNINNINPQEDEMSKLVEKQELIKEHAVIAETLNKVKGRGIASTEGQNTLACVGSA